MADRPRNHDPTRVLLWLQRPPFLGKVIQWARGRTIRRRLLCQSLLLFVYSRFARHPIAQHGFLSALSIVELFGVVVGFQVVGFLGRGVTMVDPGTPRLFYQRLRLQTRISRYTGVKIPRDRGYRGVNYGLSVCAASVAYKYALPSPIRLHFYMQQ